MLDQSVRIQGGARNLPPKFVVIDKHIVDVNQVWYVEDERGGGLTIRMIGSSHYVYVNATVQEVYKLLNG